MSRSDSGLGIGHVLHLLFNHDTDALDRATRHSVHPNATVVASYQCRGNQQYEREPLRYGRRADIRGLLPFAPCMIDTYRLLLLPLLLHHHHLIFPVDSRLILPREKSVLRLRRESHLFVDWAQVFDDSSCSHANRVVIGIPPSTKPGPPLSTSLATKLRRQDDVEDGTFAFITGWACMAAAAAAATSRRRFHLCNAVEGEIDHGSR